MDDLVHAGMNHEDTWCGASRLKVATFSKWNTTTCRACLDAGMATDTHYGAAQRQLEALEGLDALVDQAITSIAESNTRLNQGG